MQHVCTLRATLWYFKVDFNQILYLYSALGVAAVVISYLIMIVLLCVF